MKMYIFENHSTAGLNLNKLCRFTTKMEFIILNTSRISKANTYLYKKNCDSSCQLVGYAGQLSRSKTKRGRNINT